MAYCSFSMNVGSFNDPENRQGLAHFLEHMIFMGSEKYPDESAFSELISANGGYSNAYTEYEYTNYQFQVDYKVLKEALDMKAWLFHRPLMKKEAMDREIKAVENEFQGQYVSDQCRMEQLMCEQTCEGHLMNSFGWGNLKSLENGQKETLWEDLRLFYEREYSADRLKVVIQVKTEDDLAELRQWVTESFSIIENKGLGLQNFSLLQKS